MYKGQVIKWNDLTNFTDLTNLNDITNLNDKTNLNPLSGIVLNVLLESITDSIYIFGIHSLFKRLIVYVQYFNKYWWDII